MNDLLDLISQTNTYHPKLKFTHVISRTGLDVLDLTFYPKDNRLEHKTFQKSMNKYLYIPKFSNHPPSTLKGFIKGELTRYKRTNSEYHNELAIRKLFYKRLLERGYSKSYLNDIFNSFPMNQLPKAYSNPAVEAIQVLPYIQSTRVKRLKRFFHNTDLLPYPLLRIIPVWSSNPNLGKLLLQSKLSKEQTAYLASNGFH